MISVAQHLLEAKKRIIKWAHCGLQHYLCEIDSIDALLIFMIKCMKSIKMYHQDQKDCWHVDHPYAMLNDWYGCSFIENDALLAKRWIIIINTPYWICIWTCIWTLEWAGCDNRGTKFVIIENRVVHSPNLNIFKCNIKILASKLIYFHQNCIKFAEKSQFVHICKKYFVITAGPLYDALLAVGHVIMMTTQCIDLHCQCEILMKSKRVRSAATQHYHEQFVFHSHYRYLILISSTLPEVRRVDSEATHH